MISRIKQLETREKVILSIGIAFILIVIIVYGIYQPYRNALSRAERTIAAKQSQIKEVRTLQAEYRNLQDQMKRAEVKLDRADGTSALALIEDIASDIDSRENLNYIRPQPPQTQGEFHIENLDIKFEKLDLQKVVQLLWRIDTAETQLQVKNLQLKQRFDNRSQLDATLTVSAFRRIQ